MGTITYNLAEYTPDNIKKWTGDWEAEAIPVDLSTTTPVTLARLVTATLTTGDLLEVGGWARVTNDVGYTVGIGFYMKGYEYTLPGVVNPYFDIETWNGQNVTKNGLMHHMPIQWSGLWEVPAEHDGKRVVICFRADAHSTAWISGDKITVDQGYGAFHFRHLKKNP